jgi:hypothetical protein
MSDEPDTSEEARVEMAELACSRAEALGTGVIVAGFASSGRAQVFDVEWHEGELQLVPVATVPVVLSAPSSG